jgi:hypothetical protein
MEWWSDEDWSGGMLEYWSNGYSENPIFHHSMIPITPTPV